MRITLADMVRQSKDADGVSGDVERTRARFSERLRKRVVDELGIPLEKAPAWLQEKMGVRWQTAQSWLNGVSFPLGHNLTKLSEAVGVDARDLLGPLTDDVEPTHPSWRTFLATPEAASMTDQERWAMRLFWWAKPPTVGDYRSLLALIRSNAERD